MFNWAAVRALVESSPFRVGGVTVVKLRSETARSRRLAGDKEDRLLAAGGRLSDLIVAALESGCRKGNCCRCSGTKSDSRHALSCSCRRRKRKRRRTRVPISRTAASILEGARQRSAGDPLPPYGVRLWGRRGRRAARSRRVERLMPAGGDRQRPPLPRPATGGGLAMDGCGVPLATIQRWLGTRTSRRRPLIWRAIGGDERRSWRLRAEGGARAACDTQ